MRQVLRILPLAALRARYLDGSGEEVGGFVWDAESVAGLSPRGIREVLGLDWRRPDGGRAFPESEPLGYLLLPVSSALRARLGSAATRSAGGSLPDPPARTSFSGTGFAPGEPWIPELLLATGPLPARTELGRIAALGARLPLAEWTGSRWRQR